MSVSDPKPSVEFPESGHSRSCSITLSARIKIEWGIFTPTLADFIYTMSSNLVGCSIGMSGGVASLEAFAFYLKNINEDAALV